MPSAHGLLRLGYFPPIGLLAFKLSFAGLAITCAQAAKTTTDEADETRLELPRIEVLGSRLPRASEEGRFLPVVELGRVELARSGYAGLAELLRTRPEFTATGINDNVAVSTTRGANAVELRALGAGNLLFLVNGRRVTPSANAFGLVTFVDVNRFPVGLLERVEILKGAGAAVYGTDAVAGVINLIPRRSEAKPEFTLHYGNAPGHDAAEWGGVITGGARGEAWSLGVAYDFFRRQAMRAADSPRFASANLIPRYLASDPFYDGTAATTPAYLDGRSSFGPAARFSVRPGQVNGVNGVAVPGLPPGVSITRLPGTGATSTEWLAQATPSFTAPFGGLTGGNFAADAAATFVAPELTAGDPAARNRYDYVEFVWLVPAATRHGLALNLTHRPGRGPEFFLDVQYQANRSVIEAPPPTLSVTVPRTHPYNPFGVEVEAAWRLVEVGARRSQVSDDTLAAQGGWSGGLAGGRWELGLAYSRNDYRDTVSNLVGRAELAAALARTDAGALNPFGGAGWRHEAALIAGLRRTGYRAGVASLGTADLSWRGPVASWRAGTLQGVFLGEVRRETLSYDGDADSRAGMLLGIAPGLSVSGWARHSRAVAAELSVPLIAAAKSGGPARLNLHTAARAETYDEGGGSGLRPTLGLEWRPVPAWQVRASLARTFRSPNLPQLFSPRQVDGWDALADLRRPVALTGDPFDGPNTRLVGTGGNPALAPETGEVRQAGIVWHPPARAGVTYSLALDAFDYRLAGVISSLGVTEILRDELGATGALVRRDAGQETYTNLTGGPIPVLVGPAGETRLVNPGESISVPGRLREISDYLINLQSREVAGFEATVKGEWMTGVGRFELGATAMRIERQIYRVNPASAPVDAAGLLNNPHWRGQVALDWSRLAWTAGATVSTIGPSGGYVPHGFRMPAHHVTDLRLGRTFGSGAHETVVSLSVLNAFNTPPPLFPDPGIGGYAHSAVARPQGRFLRMTISRKF